MGDVDTGCPATSASLLQAKREADKATLESVFGLQLPGALLEVFVIEGLCFLWGLLAW